MMAISFLAAAFFLVKEMKRKESQNLMRAFPKKILKGKPATTEDYLWNVIGGFIVGYKVLPVFLDFNSFANDPQHFLLNYNGNFIGGLIFAAAVCYLKYLDIQKERKKYPEPTEITMMVMPHQMVGDITLLAALSGLVGAKVFAGLESPSTFFQTLLSPFEGLTFYGGLFFGALTVIWYIRKKKISIIHMADAVAPSLILAYGVGRIGCQLSGDGDWGIANTAAKPSWFFLPDWMWSFRYPHNVIDSDGSGVFIPGCTGKYCTMLKEPVFPTPFYEAVVGILIFIFLWSIRKKLKVPGMLFSIYLILNGIERFMVELIRVNVRYEFLGISFTQAEMIALMMIALGIVGVILTRKRFQKQNQIE